jgi:hypothetical protein
MKKIISILLFIGLYVNADVNYELKFYERVIPLIFKTPVHIYADSDIKFILKNSSKFIIEKNCKDAVVLIGNIKNTNCTKPLFATDYEVYKLSPNSFGAFYWRKGRPQLKFKRDKLKEFNIKLDKTLEKYIK